MANIEKRGESSWRLSLDVGFDANGKRVQHRKTVRVDDPDILKSKKKLEAYLQAQYVAFREQVESGQYIKPDRSTFEDFVAVWKANYADHKLGAYTRRNYNYVITSRLLPEFGHMELRKIQTMHIVAFLTKLRDPENRQDGHHKPLSTNTQLNIYKTLKSILDAAVKWKVIEKNPMDGVDRPAPDKVEKKELRTKKRSYTPEEADQLVVALQDEPFSWRMYILGLMIGGFRRGELLGLEWPEVDFEQNGLHIRKQISVNEKGRAVEAELKTESSEGFVSMPGWYMRDLARYRKQWLEDRVAYGDKWIEGKQYVFCGDYGKMRYPNTPTMYWHRFLERHSELPFIRLHDLRHTAAMLLRDEGVDLKTIQERLRHSKLSTTADFYAHESEKISRQAADHLERFDPKKIVKP